MDKHDVARILEEIATLLAFQAENPFKVRAYEVAARSLEDIDEDLELLVAENRLKEVPGIGEHIAEKIETLVVKGRLPYYEKLKKSIPDVYLELMAVQGLGAKRIKILCETLPIKSIDDLTVACQKGLLSTIKGFGPKSEANILRNIGKLKAYGKRVLWWEAGKLALPLLEKMSALKVVQQAEVAGSFRRKLETVGDLDFLAASDRPEAVSEWFVTQPTVDIVQAKGKTKSSVRLLGDVQADLRVIPKSEFAYALLYFTGSKEFNIHIRQRANQQGLTLNEYEMKPLPGKKKKVGHCETEEEIFHALGLAYIPPELREGSQVIEVAEKNELPHLVEDHDIRGVFHCHTTDSDGHNTLHEMAKAADELGWDYLGISDHSKSSYQANGMDEERLLNQLERIRKINREKKHRAHLFAGLECDILNDGSMDFPDEILKKLDFVIASVHRSFSMEEKMMTARVIKAVENPYTTFIGHITGRILLRRDPYQINLPKVIDACIANGKIIELNAFPNRLDMDWRLWHRAAEKGLLCSINPDAHSTSHLGYYIAGVNVARKGWLEKKNILNTRALAQVKKYLKVR